MSVDKHTKKNQRKEKGRENLCNAHVSANQLGVICAFLFFFLSLSAFARFLLLPGDGKGSTTHCAASAAKGFR